MKLLGPPGSMRDTVRTRLQGLFSTTPRSSQDNEDAVGLLSEKAQPTPLATCRAVLRNINHKLTIAFALLGALLLLFALAYSSKLKNRRAVGALPPLVEDHYLHIITFAQPTYSELCRTVFASTVLGYPVPYVTIPKTATEGEQFESESALNRMQSILEVLERIPQANDTALIIGNPSTWFQVRPDVLLRRYLNSQNSHAQKLLRTFGNETLVTHGIDSKVLFASSKVCESVASSKKGCFPLQLDDGSQLQLSHDFSIGQVKYLRPIYQHAAEQANELARNNITFDEHSIFGDLLQKQETYRQSLTGSTAPEDETHHNEDEFGISLDNSDELRYLEEGRGDIPTWTTHGDDKAVKANLPADIAKSVPPYWTVFQTLENRSWAEVPLLVHEEKVPALIQLGKGAAPSLKTTSYEKLWFHPHARELFNSEALIATSPPVSLIDPKTGIQQRFWTRPYDKIGVKTADEHFFPWVEVCNDRQVAEDVFMDGKGPWQDSRP
ncbi:hypothetical protein Slin14017_G069310 [Septoria linicola]|nr:hypothetical protein Slin14017_G069310 [Septoria linicola]